ncbi:unnamed protein product [Cylindrotheca closterium]|uniref:Oxidation resistance protein 1 n=1 Tax=Cylindrotheca closterium TaxID=2856 RepID=A0AAD2JJH8_9STRA|nr:unnamed protein product [Cylindrotheca closterium]
MNMNTVLDSVQEESFRQKLHSKRASLTPAEAAFLHALLIEDPSEEKRGDSERSPLIKQASKLLDDDILFSIPVPLLDKEDAAKIDHDDVVDVVEEEKRRPTVVKKPEDYRLLVGLWQAHEDGVTTKQLTELNRGKMNLMEDETKENGEDDDNDNSIPFDEKDKGADEQKEDDEKTAASDVEVRGKYDARSEDSSWNEDEVDHFDAWEVLKDEYASDFGFDYSVDGRMPSMDEGELDNPGFKILGTSADDTSAHPHVLSPPLIDAVTTFIPDHLQGQNLWLKYSMIRDGASLETFKQYARASKDTILAIETTKGDVFGCYTSAAWRTNPSFFGGKSMVWKMRHNRHTPCHSLFEQAEMESEIDVFMLVEEGQKPQCCTHDKLGIGAGKLRDYDFYGKDLDQDHDTSEDAFAIAVQDDLLSGTTSKCHTFRNSCLINSEVDSESFQVLNLELWTFTPCFNLDSAEKLEMTQFFMSESIRSSSMMSQRSNDSIIFSSRDLDQHSFYRRVGHDDANEEMREQWQYRTMMDGEMSSGRGMATPRFNNAVASRR